mmetsp:Transcript_19492/g.58471  ORF Transcript_19492/g.58471 Transcript_19492/m.58471 type:complete len:300 (+) Transcript_19492:95-994(+)
MDGMFDVVVWAVPASSGSLEGPLETPGMELQALTKLVDSFTQLGMDMCRSGGEEEEGEEVVPELGGEVAWSLVPSPTAGAAKGGPVDRRREGLAALGALAPRAPRSSQAPSRRAFSWAIAGPSEQSVEFLQLQRQLEQLARAMLTASQLGCESSDVRASPSLLKLTERDLSDLGALHRRLTKRAKLLVCMSAIPGPEDMLAKACLESSTDLVIAGPDADLASRFWRGELGRLARRCGTRFLRLRGLSFESADARTSCVVKAARALLDPIRSTALCAAGVHERFPDTVDAESSSAPASRL